MWKCLWFTAGIFSLAGNNWQKVSTEESDYWRVKYNFKSINLVIFHWLKKFMKAKFCFVCVFYSKIVEGMMIVKYWSASKIALSLRVQYVRDKGRIRLLLLYLELDTSHSYWKSTQGLIQKKKVDIGVEKGTQISVPKIGIPMSKIPCINPWYMCKFFFSFFFIFGNF